MERSGSQPVQTAAQGGQVQAQGVALAQHAARRCPAFCGGATVPAILRRSGAENQPSMAGIVEIQRVLIVRFILRVEHDQEGGAVRTGAGEGEHAVLHRFAGDPLEAAAVIFAAVQCGLLQIQPVQVFCQPQEAGAWGTPAGTSPWRGLSSHSRKWASSVPMKLSFLPGCSMK